MERGQREAIDDIKKEGLSTKRVKQYIDSRDGLGPIRHRHRLAHRVAARHGLQAPRVQRHDGAQHADGLWQRAVEIVLRERVL